jgi:hypothetical protein
VAWEILLAGGGIWQGKSKMGARHPSLNLIAQKTMLTLAFMTPMFGAIGYSLIYLLFGGGLGGAVLIFIIAKMLGK